MYKDDNFEKTISLDKGSNTININVEHDKEDTTYTLNVYRGKVSALTNTIQLQILKIFQFKAM